MRGEGCSGGERDGKGGGVDSENNGEHRELCGFSFQLLSEVRRQGDTQCRLYCTHAHKCIVYSDSVKTVQKKYNNINSVHII